MSPRFPSLTYHDIVKLAKQAEFIFWRQAKGSHEIWKRMGDGKRTTIPNHQSKPLKRKTIKSILDDLEIDWKDVV